MGHETLALEVPTVRDSDLVFVVQAQTMVTQKLATNLETAAKHHCCYWKLVGTLAQKRSYFLESIGSGSNAAHVSEAHKHQENWYMACTVVQRKLSFEALAVTLQTVGT